MIKRFKEWIELKERLHNVPQKNLPFFKEGEVWWCSIGDNIKSEINGKSKYFSRPVLIFKKFSKDLFFGLPLTSRFKTGTWFVSVSFLSRNQTIVLNQGRTLNISRLKDLFGQFDESDFKKIKAGFSQLYLNSSPDKGRSWEIPKNILLHYFNKIILYVKSKI